MSNPNPPVARSPAPRWLVWLGVLALASYGVLIARNFVVVAGGSDSSGYLNSARLFAAGKLRTELRVPAEFGAVNGERFQPLGFFAVNSAQITPTYPTGLPLHFALAGKIFGWDVGPLLVGLCATLGAVGLCYAVGRELGLTAPLAAAGAAALAACPVFLFTSIQPMSDTLATTWCLAAVWAALRAQRSPAWAIGCGTAFAIAVLVRPTNLLLAPALLVLLGFDWRRLALFGLGGLPGAAWLAIYNHALYGGALRSGYGDWFGAFAWHWGAPTAWHFTKWLALLLPAPLLLLALLAKTHPESPTRARLALATWFFAITGAYAFYEVSHEVWWCLRFILPAMPAVILAGLLGLEALARKRTERDARVFRHVGAAVIACWCLGLALYWTSRFHILATKEGELTYARACRATLAQFPPNTLVVTMSLSGAFYYYSDLPVLRWDQLNAPEFARLAALARRQGRQICAVEFKWEEPRALRELCPGDWVRVGTIDNVGIWRLGEPAAQ